MVREIWIGLFAALAPVLMAGAPASAQQTPPPQQQTKPNILFIMGDEIGFMQPSIYHRGLMVGETPNIDRIGNEGAIFMDYVAMQSVVFTTDNGAEAISFPDGGVTPFKGQKGEAWEGGYRAPLVVRWPGRIKPGTVHNQLFAALDWVPTLVDIAGGPKGEDLKKQIEGGQYPGIVKTTLDGFNQRDYLEGKSEKSAATSSTTTPPPCRRRSATRTGRCTTPCRNPGHRGGSCL
jgi:arylsulfatase A-like enzyme